MNTPSDVSLLAKAVRERLMFAKTLARFIVPSSEGYMEFQVSNFAKTLKVDESNTLIQELAKSAATFEGNYCAMSRRSLEAHKKSLVVACADSVCNTAMRFDAAVACPDCKCVFYCSKRCQERSRAHHVATRCVSSPDFALHQAIDAIYDDFERWHQSFGRKTPDAIMGCVTDEKLGSCVRWRFAMPLLIKANSNGLSNTQAASTLASFSEILNSPCSALDMLAFVASVDKPTGLSDDNETHFAFSFDTQQAHVLANLLLHIFGTRITPKIQAMLCKGVEETGCVACFVCGRAVRQLPVAYLFESNPSDMVMERLASFTRSSPLKYGAFLAGINDRGAMQGYIFYTCSDECAKLYNPVAMPQIIFTLVPQPHKGTFQPHFELWRGVPPFMMSAD